MRSRASRRRKHRPRGGDTEAERLRLFPRAEKSPVHESLSHFQCCRGLSESVTQQDPPAATDSTSQIDAGSFRAMAEDSAESIRQRDDAPRHVVPRLRQCWFQKARLDDRLRDVAIHQMLQAQPARSWKAALARCCRRIRDNLLPRFRLHGHSTSRPLQWANAQRGLRCHKSAERTRPHCL